MKTKVLFLIESNSNVYEKGVVFAYFPKEKYSSDPNLFTCYAHIGQHSACHVDYVKGCDEAKFEQYNDLKIELESIGYKLDVLNDDFKRQDAINKGKVWQVYPAKDMDNVLFEGGKTKCKKFIKDTFHSAYKNGQIRLGKVIMETV